jgi:hypothetical protein
MHDVVPDVQLVYVVRDPLARIVSHYRYALTEGWETRPIDLAVRANTAEFIAPSRYAFQLEPFLARFDREQLHIVVSEDLRDDRVATLRRLYEFLGVDPSFTPPDVDEVRHKGSDLRQAPSAVQRLRKSAAYRAVRPLVPRGVRDGAWKATTREPNFAPEQFVLAPETRDAIVESLQGDLAALRGIMGGAFHCWGYLEPT